MATLELKLDDDESIFVSVDSPDGDGQRNLGRPTDEHLVERFEKVSDSVAKLAQIMRNRLDDMKGARPDNVQLEFGVQLRGKANLWLVEGESTAHMKISLTWNTTSAST